MENNTSSENPAVSGVVYYDFNAYAYDGLGNSLALTEIITGASSAESLVDVRTEDINGDLSIVLTPNYPENGVLKFAADGINFVTFKWGTYALTVGCETCLFLPPLPPINENEIDSLTETGIYLFQGNYADYELRNSLTTPVSGEDEQIDDLTFDLGSHVGAP